MENTMKMKTMITGVLFTASLVACGGGQKAGGSGVGGGKEPPPPPDVTQTGPVAPKREISEDAKKDYAGALATFNTNDKAGPWSEAACRGSAQAFEAVAREHTDLVEAQFMAGLSYHRCKLYKEAESAYQKATGMKGDPSKIAMAMSNLGEIYYQQGKVDAAKDYWNKAITANNGAGGKLIGARVNIASLELEAIRKIGNPKDPNWKKQEEDARFNLSNVLGVDSDNVVAYTVYGLIYMEGWKTNKNRLDLAKLLLDEGKKRNEKYAPLQNAYGLLYMHRGALSLALQSFQAAVELDGNFAEARENVGNTTLSFRNYDVAKTQFTEVIKLAPKNYDAYIGLGAALRGLKDYDGAEAQYKKAKDIDPKRGEAYYNLAVLYKDFRASKQDDLKASLGTYGTAKDYFKQFLDKDAEDSDKAEAKEQIALIDKTTTQIQQFIKAQANMPAQPPTPPPAPGPAAGAGGQGGAAPAPPAK
jgi:tetratricopeptide (TPR) repeat protein